MTDSLDEALLILQTAKALKEAKIRCVARQRGGGVARVDERKIQIDILTDQTSAHDTLNGYVPAHMSYEAAARFAKDRSAALRETRARINLSNMSKRCSACRSVARSRSITATTFAVKRLRTESRMHSTFPDSCPSTFVRCSAMAKGRSAGLRFPAIPRISIGQIALVMETFPENKPLCRWIEKAQKQVHFQGLPARICWLGYGERAKMGKIFNDLVARGEVKAPIVIGRDHLDCGSVASPNRETEKMKDGSDAIADWPILNALLNATGGASWVSVHHGGGVGMGMSIHAGMVVVADGTKEAEDATATRADV